MECGFESVVICCLMLCNYLCFECLFLDFIFNVVFGKVIYCVWMLFWISDIFGYYNSDMFVGVFL